MTCRRTELVTSSSTLSFCSIDATNEPAEGQIMYGRLVNHARGKDQNARMKIIEVDNKPHLCLFAIKSIKGNDEILYDYGIKRLPWEMKVGGKLSWGLYCDHDRHTAFIFGGFLI